MFKHHEKPEMAAPSKLDREAGSLPEARVMQWRSRCTHLSGRLFQSSSLKFNLSFITWKTFFFHMPMAYENSWARGQTGAVAEAHAPATATPDPSRICNLHGSSRQCWMLNPLCEARDRTCILMETMLDS